MKLKGLNRDDAKIAEMKKERGKRMEAIFNYIFLSRV